MLKTLRMLRTLRRELLKSLDEGLPEFVCKRIGILERLVRLELSARPDAGMRGVDEDDDVVGTWQCVPEALEFVEKVVPQGPKSVNWKRPRCG